MASRTARLLIGLVGFGFSLALMIRANLGLGPWDVLHHGLSKTTGLRIGPVVIGVAAAVLLLWIPLRQRPGPGTIANVVVVGWSVDVSLALLGSPDAMGSRVGLLAAGIVGNAVATALYIGAGLGPGPRDGLMTGLARNGRSVRAVRTGIEITVLALGFALGGSVGVGTIAYAFAIGPLVHVLMPVLDYRRSRPCRPCYSG